MLDYNELPPELKKNEYDSAIEEAKIAAGRASAHIKGELEGATMAASNAVARALGLEPLELIEMAEKIPALKTTLDQIICPGEIVVVVNGGAIFIAGEIVRKVRAGEEAQE